MSSNSGFGSSGLCSASWTTCIGAQEGRSRGFRLGPFWVLQLPVQDHSECSFLKENHSGETARPQALQCNLEGLSNWLRSARDLSLDEMHTTVEGSVCSTSVPCSAIPCFDSWTWFPGVPSFGSHEEHACSSWQDLGTGKTWEPCPLEKKCGKEMWMCGCGRRVDVIVFHIHKSQ